MNIYVSSHRIDLTQTIPARLRAAQPQDSRQNPVPIRVIIAKIFGEYFSGRTARDQDGSYRKSGTDPGPDNVFSPAPIADVDTG